MIILSNLKAEEYKNFEQIKKIREDGTEYWNARELSEVLQYKKWENFAKVIDRAKLACNNSGLKIQDHFPEVRKMVEIGSNTIRKLIELTNMKESTLKDTVNSLLKNNIIVETTGYTRNQVFAFQKYIDLFLK